MVPDEERGTRSLSYLPHTRSKGGRKGTPHGRTLFPFLTTLIDPMERGGNVVAWKHGYVLPFYGVDIANFQLAHVYDWADSGNIIQYLDSNPKASRTHLVSPLLSNSATG